MKKFLSRYPDKSVTLWLLRPDPDEAAVILSDDQLDELAEEILLLRGAQKILKSYE